MTGPPLKLSDDIKNDSETTNANGAVNRRLTFASSGTAESQRLILLNGEIVAIEGPANKEVSIILILEGENWTYTHNGETINVTSVTSEIY